MKRSVTILTIPMAVLIPVVAIANPIPFPPPASMPLEEMVIEIQQVDDQLHAVFTGDFTFDFIPEEVTSMLFPVPPDATGIQVLQDHVELPWSWSNGLYPTVLPEIPEIPMFEWQGPFPMNGAVFTVDYEHDLIQRPEEFIFFYASGTGKYFPTYEKTTTAYVDILVPEDFAVADVWLDETTHDYEVVDSHLLVTIESQFGPIVNDLIVSLIPESSTLLSDFDSDGDVDGTDFLHWQIGFGMIDDARKADGDANGDGDVDADDCLVWQDQFDRVIGGVAAAPEPSTLAMTALGLLLGSLAFGRRIGLQVQLGRGTQSYDGLPMPSYQV